MKPYLTLPIMCNATLLVKYRLTKQTLTSTDHSIAPMEVNDKEVWYAIRAVQTSQPIEDISSITKRTRRNNKTSTEGSTDDGTVVHFKFARHGSNCSNIIHNISP